MGLTCVSLDSIKRFPLNQLLTSLATLPDPRCPGRTRHHLLALLVIAVCAVMTGAETWADLAHCGRLTQA